MPDLIPPDTESGENTQTEDEPRTTVSEIPPSVTGIENTPSPVAPPASSATVAKESTPPASPLEKIERKVKEDSFFEQRTTPEGEKPALPADLASVVEDLGSFGDKLSKAFQESRLSGPSGKDLTENLASMVHQGGTIIFNLSKDATASGTAAGNGNESANLYHTKSSEQTPASSSSGRDLFSHSQRIHVEAGATLVYNAAPAEDQKSKHSSPQKEESPTEPVDPSKFRRPQNWYEKIALFLVSYFPNVSWREFLDVARALRPPPPPPPPKPKEGEKNAAAETAQEQRPEVAPDSEEAFLEGLQNALDQCQIEFFRTGDKPRILQFAIKLTGEQARGYFEGAGYPVFNQFFDKIEQAGFATHASSGIRNGVLNLTQQALGEESVEKAHAVINTFITAVLRGSPKEESYVGVGELLDTLHSSSEGAKQKIVDETLEKIFQGKLFGSPVLVVLNCPFLDLPARFKWLGRIINEGRGSESKEFARRCIFNSLRANSGIQKETWDHLRDWLPNAQQTPREYSATNVAAIELTLLFFVDLLVGPDRQPVFGEFEFNTAGQITSTIAGRYEPDDDYLVARVGMLAFCHMLDAGATKRAEKQPFDAADLLARYDETLGTATASLGVIVSPQIDPPFDNWPVFLLAEVFAEAVFHGSNEADKAASQPLAEKIATRFAALLSRKSLETAIDHLLTLMQTVEATRSILESVRADTREEYDKANQVKETLRSRQAAYCVLAEALKAKRKS